MSSTPNTANEGGPEAPETHGDELAPGTQLSNGTYTIQSHLKTGGFGITYLASDTLGRRVVIKECFPGGMCSRSSRQVQLRSRAHMGSVASLVQRFVAEAHSLAKLDHPNIVKVHQVFKENNTAYMALDYVEGYDLLDTVRRPELALTPSGVRSTLLKLLDAIDAVHDLGLLHRDISPDNILIDSKRRPILIDFGAARDHAMRADSAASTLHVVKDGYSPQELYLAGGGDQGPWSDLYALAATYYHIITGEAPPNSQVRLAAMAANTPDPCLPLVGRFDAYDPAFLAAIDKAMSVLPKERIQSARQWISAISESEDGKVRILPVSEIVRPVTPMTRITRVEAEAARKKTGPLVFIGGAAVVALVAVGIFMALPRGDALPPAGAVKTGKAQAAETATTGAAAEVAAPDVAAAAPAPTPAPEPTPAPAVAPAPAEVAAVAPDPVPVPTPAPAEPARSDVSPLTANWTVELPFAAAESDPARVLRTTGVQPDWLVPGVQITAVNGAPVTRIDEIPGVLRQSLSPGEATSVAVLLTTVSEGASAPVERTIDLPVVHRIVLSSGAQFLVWWQGESWQTEVLALPSGYTGEMREGDIVVGHVSSGVRLNKPGALADALTADIISGSGSTRLAVQQAGQMWVVSFPLPR
jgi:serine/threonine protein kinase